MKGKHQADSCSVFCFAFGNVKRLMIYAIAQDRVVLEITDHFISIL